MQDIREFLNSYDDSTYDARISRNVRYVDQKCTPDIVCFVADCILCTECANKPFTKNDLWHTDYFRINTRVVYGKPYADNATAAREFDKVVGQPLTLLAYAHILNRSKKGRSWVYTINNMELLEYVSMNERNTYKFLLAFFHKIADVNGLNRLFDEYKSLCHSHTQLAHVTLYEKYKRFVKANSDIKKDDESDRMLHKILNVFALEGQFPGSNGQIPTLNDLLYNRVNSRDKNQKSKTQTRTEAASNTTNENALYYIQYQVNKAIRKVHQKQGNVSEVQDELATGVATAVHHIFPKSQFPTLAAFYENLILLTTSQHYQKAHPNNNTQVVDPNYQYTCLMAKSQTIENSLLQNEDFYSKENFVEVINTGVNGDLDDNASFTNIREYLIYKYILE